MKTSNKVFCIILLALFVISTFTFNAEKWAAPDNNVIAHADYDQMTVTTNITLAKSPNCIAINELTNRLYVGVEDGVVVINGETDQVITEVPLDGDVTLLVLNQLTNRIYVGVGESKFVIIDGDTLLTIYDSVWQYPDEIAVNPVTNRV